ncbi:checkpoint protein kinase [Cordyceps militaris CM01]|uniref:Checkpoint protein kinase n=1 Tax=Cordyceps militaris (strain CM01) TaxID=983644 RepID=G3JGM0_CORMM|nr:checkpoint protein kinase [Cordyceps militaris CM01]EGX93289.1 checkpoint protein kinase [Cordyceps militaris CM01]
MEDSSDDEAPSMPALQLHAVTEALLAALDPTATAAQDDTRAVGRQRDPRSRGLRGCASPPGRKRGAGGGGDSVALGPGFAAMARPPRRPQKQVTLDWQQDVLQRDLAEREEPRVGLHAMGHAQNNGGEDYEHSRLPSRDNNRHQSVRELGNLSTEAAERPPMRRVVVSPWRRRRSPPQPTAANELQPPPPPPPALATAPTKHRRIVIGGISYRILRRLGRGGSGRVYEVMAPDTRTWAFKAIPLGALDDVAKRQVENEVALLHSLRGTDRVVALEDWCVDEAKNAIHIVMQLGQIDLEHIIMQRGDTRLDPVFVGFYWREMLRCVAALHAHGIVHADIKPANFVSVDGVLKIVDFGIAHGLPDDTAHLYLEQLGGTPNYMAPETLRVLSRGEGCSRAVVRFGTPCDIWSLGCVLHRMVYGRPPFAHVAGGLAPKLLTIVDGAAPVELSAYGLGGGGVPEGLRCTMGACLERDPSRRPTAAGLLAADGLLREDRSLARARALADVMQDMATRAVRRELLDEWLAEAMEEAGLR